VGSYGIASLRLSQDGHFQRAVATLIAAWLKDFDPTLMRRTPACSSTENAKKVHFEWLDGGGLKLRWAFGSLWVALQYDARHRRVSVIYWVPVYAKTLRNLVERRVLLRRGGLRWFCQGHSLL
jgi:hypothetical protein